MSQIFSPGTGGGGPIPPEVPTSFVGDDGTSGIPAANTLNLLARDTVDNDVESIRTTADPNMSNNFYVELTNRIRGSVQTIGAVSAVVFTFTMDAVPAVCTFDVMIQGFNTTKTSACGFSLFGTAKTSGAATTIVDLPDIISNNDDPAFLGVTVGMVASLNVVEFTVTGVAGETIDWYLSGFYTKLN